MAAQPRNDGVNIIRHYYTETHYIHTLLWTVQTCFSRHIKIETLYVPQNEQSGI